MNKTPKISLTISNSEWIHANVVQYLISRPGRGRYPIAINLKSAKPYEHSLNTCVQRALEGGFDFWMNIDHDNPPTPGWDPLDMVEKNLDVVGFPTPIWHEMEDDQGQSTGRRLVYYNCYTQTSKGRFSPRIVGDDQLKAFGSLLEVDAIGSGCLLVAKRVLENVRPAFVREFDPVTGFVTTGSDLNFCRRVREAGFKVWANFDYRCEHYKMVPLRQYMDDVTTMVREAVSDA